MATTERTSTASRGGNESPTYQHPSPQTPGTKFLASAFLAGKQVHNVHGMSDLIDTIPPRTAVLHSLKSEDSDGFPFHLQSSASPTPSSHKTFPKTDGTSDAVTEPRHADAGRPVLVSNAQRDSSASADAATPASHPNVHFACSDAELRENVAPLSPREINDTNINAAHVHKRQSSKLSSRFKLFTASHARSLSEQAFGSAIADKNTASPKNKSNHREGRENANDADIDAEAIGAQEGGAAARPWRIRTKHDLEGVQTGPTTPQVSKLHHLVHTPPDTTSNPSTHHPVRRSTMTDISENQGVGVLEDEVCTRLSNSGGGMARSNGRIHGGRFSSYTTERERSSQGSSSAPRPSNFRRFTHRVNNSKSMGAPAEVRRSRTEVGAQKWRQLKAGLKLLGQKRREENKIDEKKSAELLAQLFAASPAALILASRFQRDEKDKHKIPVLLEQLKINITDSQRREDSSGDRHVVFRIELEYGSGAMRMKWVIWRSLRDFVNLHLKYKLHRKTQKYLQRHGEEAGKVKLPHFPRAAFPYLRGVRGLVDDEEDDDDDQVAEGVSGHDGNLSSPIRPDRPKKTTSSTNVNGRRSSFVNQAAAGSQGIDILGAGTDSMVTGRREPYAERQRRKLEVYLREMIRFLIFRAGSNRLCRFLELSALGVRLAGEGGYHGKEGSLVLQSGKGVDFRRALVPSLVIQRHRPMWFLVRHSYIVCVDSAEDMNIYDCFLVDADFHVQSKRPRLRDQKSAKDLAKTAKNRTAHPQNHTLRVSNAERKIRLLARTERQMIQFEESIRFMAANTKWARPNRFGGFAPVRNNCFAQWLVDGRDYMWNVSRAINMARDVIYIHDWWLSPEIYMRRPAAISHKWRLDRLLKRKAEEGVKIFVIMYRNINSAVPIDSEYTKFSLLDLHPNVYVQRSPNQVRQNVFFWAHHEKICVVDQTIAFCGGVDLCFGRWDTPAHLVVDDKLTGFEPNDAPKDADHCQLWPGKDYSNPRVLDFNKLDEPYGELYDRTKVPRMPWHDIGMQVVGQPARDLTRHFIQRWNYILRQRKPSRPTPFLLPPPDFMPAELETLGLDGTCSVQMLRSACDWSIGTPNKVECSIQNAYIKMIETSEHFVYIENQFFISSCDMDGTRIKNSIGDALVERIIRAQAAREDWLAVVMIPLMPGFQNTVDQQDGSSVRLIMQCQYRSICRGETSIFGRLRAVGIMPEDYIQFYSLRTWGKIGPTKALVTEQLYIHAKVMIVDDRLAIIGSANINERSMLGSRDSEIAAIVSDKDMIDSVMAGEPYKVSRFAHTLRMRLMREHLGVDIETLAENERGDHRHHYGLDSDDDSSFVSSSNESDEATKRKLVESKHRLQDDLIAKSDEMHSFNHDVDWEQKDNPHLKTNKRKTFDPRVTGNEAHSKDVAGFGFDNAHAFSNTLQYHGRDSITLKGDLEVLVNNTAPEGRGTISVPRKSKIIDSTQSFQYQNQASRSRVPEVNYPPADLPRLTTQELGLTQLSQLPALPITDDTDIGGPSPQPPFNSDITEALSPVLATMRRPMVDKHCMKDPLNDTFFHDTWHAVAENNTKLFRQVFRCMPDNQVTTWKEYEAFAAFGERFAHSQGMPKSNTRMQKEAPGETGPPGHGTLGLPQAAAALTHGVLHPVSAVGHLEGLKHNLSGRLSRRGSNKDTSTNGSRPETQDTTVDGQTDTNTWNEKHALQTQDDSARTHIDFDNIPTHSTPGRLEPLDEKQAVIDGDASHNRSTTGQPKRRRRATTKSSAHAGALDPLLSYSDAEALMKLVQGHLVLFPYDWLLNEERGGKWLYPVDQMAPLEIYN